MKFNIKMNKMISVCISLVQKEKLQRNQNSQINYDNF